MASYTQSSYVEAQAEEFDVFTVAPTFAATEKLYYVSHRPSSQITTDSSPIEFSTSGQGLDYTDLKHSQIHVKAKILKSDGTELTANENATPVNLWLHSLFSQVDISLNGKLITSSSNLYPYKSYLRVLLNETNPAKASVLQSQLYYKDTANFMDATNSVTGNMGLLNRDVLSKESKSVDMCGPLYEDFMDVKRFLQNGVDLQIRLYRTSPAFSLMSDKTDALYKVKIEDVYLQMCKIRPNNSVITSHARLLQHNTAKYPFIKSDIKVASLPKGQLNYTIDKLFQNKVPNKIVVGLVSAVAVNGSYTKNPFNFALYDLSSIVLYVNGESLPSGPMTISIHNCVTAYQALFEGRQSVGLNITRKDFDDGYGLYQFSLEPYHLKEGHLDLIRRGNLRFQLQFSVALPETVNCLLYSEDSLMVEIDEARITLYSTP